MKLNFSLKNKEANIEADVEKLVEKRMEYRAKNQIKTRYQIKHEEKRKTAELEHKQKLQMIIIGAGLFAILMVFIFVMAILENQGII